MTLISLGITIGREGLALEEQFIYKIVTKSHWKLGINTVSQHILQRSEQTLEKEDLEDRI